MYIKNWIVNFNCVVNMKPGLSSSIVASAECPVCKNISAQKIYMGEYLVDLIFSLRVSDEATRALEGLKRVIVSSLAMKRLCEECGVESEIPPGNLNSLVRYLSAENNLRKMEKAIKEDFRRDRLSIDINLGAS